MQQLGIQSRLISTQYKNKNVAFYIDALRKKKHLRTPNDLIAEFKAEQAHASPLKE